MPSPAITQLPDEELMLLIANGLIQEPAAELFRRHNHGLYNFIAWMCKGNVHEAEDITQKTWVKLMTACAHYQPSARFRTFLYQIAHNAVLDLRRSHGETTRADLDEADELAGTALTPEAEWMLQQNLQQVRSALLQLPAAQREVIVLRFFADMSLDEIAATVGEGYETVKSRLRYAYTRLRQELGALA